MSVSSDFTRILWIDYSGISRCKVVPTNRIHDNVHLVRAGMAITLWGTYPPDATLGPIGEVTLLPPSVSSANADELGQLFRSESIPWHPRHSITLASMYESSLPWVHCPRYTLQKAVDICATFGINARAGFEMEFGFLDDDELPQHSAPFGNTNAKASSVPPLHFDAYASAHAFDNAAHVIDEITDALAAMKIGVTLTHAEGGDRQFEIALRHASLTRAVDDVVLAREAVRSVARRHGLRATFAPRYGRPVGSGGHFHISLDGRFGTKDRLQFGGANGDDGSDANDIWIGMDTTAQSFMAGVVDALPWLMFPLNGNPLSYERVKPYFWVGAHQAWGIDNKETPVRLAGDRTNFEVKVGDATSNVYLALAAVLTAGINGVKKEMPLCAPCQIIPADAIGKDDGAFPLLPTSLEEAMERMREACKDELVNSVFPDEVVDNWMAVKREEIRFTKENGMDGMEKAMSRLY